MYFNRITLSREKADPERISRMISRDGYGIHQRLWEIFEGPGIKDRDFLFRRDDQGKWPRFFVVSAREPAHDRGPWEIQTKPYSPHLKQGQRLFFALRANPIVTGKNLEGKHARHDVVMNAKRRLENEGKPKDEWPLQPELVQQEGIKWLSTRMDRYGFSVDPDEVRADGYTQHRLPKPKSKKGIRLSTIDFSGRLTVVDPDAFLKALYTGIGPAKGLGCGMLMVRRI